MNFQEIKAKLQELDIEESIFPEENIYEKKEKLLMKELGNFELVDEFGGGEGEGETCHRVYHFTDHDVYIRWDGWYSSGDDSHYESAGYEVRPQQRMITVFE